MSNIVIPDGGNIGSASDTDAISISSGGNVTLSQTLDGGAIGSAVTMSANQACVKTALNASGNASIYAVRAWVQFNGLSGTTGDNKTIVGSGNVSSVGEVSTGKFKINFTQSLPNATYAAVVNHAHDGSSYGNYGDGSRASVHNNPTRNVDFCYVSTSVDEADFTDMNTVDVLIIG